jgi:hypothetical protein
MSKNLEELKRNTDQILQGIRIVLPGTQAVMGFQFIAFFNPVFQNLPSAFKTLHFITLILSILCSLCLIAPVAFQQIGEDGRATNRFLKFTKKMLSIAMLFLLLSVVGDLYVAAKVISIDPKIALLISATLFCVGMFLWYGYALVKRNSKDINS